jgi:hypothetical protein
MAIKQNHKCRRAAMIQVQGNGEAVGGRRVTVVTEARRSPGSQKLTVVSQTLVFGPDGRFIETADRSEQTIAMEGISM